MFGKKTVVDMINRSAENEGDRRNFLKVAGLSGLGAVGAGVIGTAGATEAHAGDSSPSDAAVLNFALNLEYLEAEFYLRAYYGRGLAADTTDGRGRRGPVTGGRRVRFTTPAVRQYAREIAEDELNHVQFLRRELGSAAVARPAINLRESFTAAARAAGLVGPAETFDPFANENNFLLAAFIFEDVGVTAYKGAAPLIRNKTYLEAAAGILAVEAYHAGIIRTVLYSRGLFDAARRISNARDSLDNRKDVDRGIGTRTVGNLVPANGDSIVYSRSAADVLNIVYLNPDEVRRGGFFPAGVNGLIKTSSAR